MIAESEVTSFSIYNKFEVDIQVSSDSLLFPWDIYLGKWTYNDSYLTLNNAFVQ